MRKLLLPVIAPLILLFPAASRAAAQDFRAEMQGVKARQKAGRKALTTKQKFAKQSLKVQHIPKA